MNEHIIFNNNDWINTNNSKCSIKDNYITNKKSKVHTDFSFELSPSFEDYLQTQHVDPHISAEIEKETNEEINNLIYESSTNFYEGEKKEKTIEQSSIDIDCNWFVNSYDHEEKIEISLNSSDNKIILNNNSEIMLKRDDITKYIQKSSENSIGDIKNFISNSMNNLNIKIRYVDNILAVKIAGSGFESIWYKMPTEFKSLKNINIKRITDASKYDNIKSNFRINNIYNGFSKGSFDKTINSLENDTVWNSIEINTMPNISQFSSDDFFNNNNVEKDDNTILLKLYAANNTEQLQSDFSSNNYKYKTNKEIKETIMLDDIDIKGKYLKIEFIINNSKLYQNQINYLKTSYDFFIEKEEVIDNEITELQESFWVNEQGKVLELGDNKLSATLYIPPNAINLDNINSEYVKDGAVEITIKRISEDDYGSDKNAVWYEFTPSMKFKKDCILELNYSGFKFGTYQSPEGLNISHYNPDDDRINNLETRLIKDKEKIVSYVSHFSKYGIVASDNLYSERTSHMADKMPQWMSLQQKDSNFQQLLNYSAANPLDELSDAERDSFNNKFIDRADTSLRYKLYKTKLRNFKYNDESFDINNIKNLNNINEEINIKADNNNLEITLTEEEILNKEKCCYIDMDNSYIYFQKEFQNITININNTDSIFFGNKFVNKKPLSYHHLWNVFDEFGLLVGLERLKDESNQSFKERILNVYKEPPSDSKSGLTNHISRTLNISKDDLQINELNDKEYIEKLFIDDRPSIKLQNIINKIQKKFNIFWGDCKWDVGYWDVINNEGDGYKSISSNADYNSPLTIEKTALKPLQ